MDSHLDSFSFMLTFKQALLPHLAKAFTLTLPWDALAVSNNKHKWEIIKGDLLKVTECSRVP